METMARKMKLIIVYLVIATFLMTINFTSASGIFKHEGELCDDNDSCTKNDRIVNSICVGIMKDCDDGRNDTRDFCLNDICVHEIEIDNNNEENEFEDEQVMEKNQLKQEKQMDKQFGEIESIIDYNSFYNSFNYNQNNNEFQKVDSKFIISQSFKPRYVCSKDNFEIRGHTGGGIWMIKHEIVNYINPNYTKVEIVYDDDKVVAILKLKENDQVVATKETDRLPVPEAIKKRYEHITYNFDFATGFCL